MSAETAPEADDGSPRRRIMAAAERLLAVRGYDNLRLRDVAKEAGISIGMIQHYFDTRDELVRGMLVAACERRALEWTRLAAGEHDSAGRVKALLTGAAADPERCIVWVETCAAASRYPELQPVVSSTNGTWRQALAEAVRDGAEAGQFKPAAAADEVADTFVSLIDGLMIAVATRNPSFTPEYVRTLLLRTAQVHLHADLGDT